MLIRTLLRSTAAMVGTAVALASVPGSAAPRGSGEAVDFESALAPQPSGGSGPVVHAVNMLPDEERGFVKLARYVDSSAARAGQSVVVTTRYAELCQVPCGVPVATSDRPILFFIRDGQPVSHGFRIPAGAEEVTLKVRPLRRPMHGAGWGLIASLVLFPFGIPLVIVGKPKVWIGEGAPRDGQPFARLKKAKV